MSKKMSQPTKPEPTQADRERASAFIESITEQLRNPSYGDCSYEHIKPGSDDGLASELASVRDGRDKEWYGEFIAVGWNDGYDENLPEVPNPDAVVLWAKTLYERGRSAGAAEMVERCAEYVKEEIEIALEGAGIKSGLAGVISAGIREDLDPNHSDVVEGDVRPSLRLLASAVDDAIHYSVHGSIYIFTCVPCNASVLAAEGKDAIEHKEYCWVPVARALLKEGE